MSVLNHLKGRHFDFHLHTAWINEDDKCATFPIWNLSGQLVGYQVYRPDASKEKNNDPREGRYFTRVKEGKVGVWGLESWNLSNTLFVTEGVFDAARLTNAGFAAIAVCGNDVSPTTRSWLNIVRSNRNTVSVCDNDNAGRKLRYLGHTFHVVEYGDMGDASDEYVANFLSEYN